jgi:H-type lectin domain
MGGFVPDPRETIAGNTLIAEAIQSQDFVTGVAGWQIAASGSAEFNNLTARGSLITTGSNGSYIRITQVSGAPFIFLYPGDAPGFTVVDAVIKATEFISGGNSFGSLTLQSAQVSSGPIPSVAILQLTSQTSGLGSPAQVRATGQLVDAVQNHEYMRGQNGSVPISFAAVTSFTQAVVFASAFAAAPIVTTNINSGAGAAAQWHSRAINITTTGFTMLVFASAAGTWTNIPVQWSATEPTL